MKITHAQIKQIIKEELENVMNENDLDAAADQAHDLMAKQRETGTIVGELMNIGLTSEQIQALVDLNILRPSDVNADVADQETVIDYVDPHLR